MVRSTMSRPAPGFHEGELAVQRRLGVSEEASHLVRMLDPVELSGGIVDFLAQRTFAVMTARDRAGVLWTSPLTGPEGFLHVAGPTELAVGAVPRPGDPLAGVPAGQDVGLITLELARRRRVRLNGHLAAVGAGGLSVQIEQAYGNCPQYIQQRLLAPASPEEYDEGQQGSAAAEPADRLSAEDQAQIAAADTFFLGSTHPTRGNDASHRGGPAGFVRVQDETTLWWPDYAGNNMFNTLGNLAVDPTAALLFIDFDSGRTLHLTGRSFLETTAPGAPGDDGHTGRRIRFELTGRTTGARLPLRALATVSYPRNPPTT